MSFPNPFFIIMVISRFLILETVNVTIPLVPLLIFGLVFDFALFVVVLVHIRCVSRLTGQIRALEASTDILLQSQAQLTTLMSQLIS
jgi:hypothetical protein